MPEKLDRLRRMDEFTKQALQDQLLGSLDGDGRYDHGVATSLPAPARQTIQSAGIVPPKLSAARTAASMELPKAPLGRVGRVEPSVEAESGGKAAMTPRSSGESGAQDPERESLERLVARLGTRGLSSAIRSEPPVIDGAMGLEAAQEFLRELETQPRDSEDSDDSPPHAVVSF